MDNVIDGGGFWYLAGKYGVDIKGLSKKEAVEKIQIAQKRHDCLIAEKRQKMINDELKKPVVSLSAFITTLTEILHTNGDLPVLTEMITGCSWDIYAINDPDVSCGAVIFSHEV